MNRVKKQLPALEQPNNQRDADIAVEMCAKSISTNGGMAVVRNLANGDDALRNRLATTWNLARVGFSNPVSPKQAQDAAVELLTAWAQATGRQAMVPHYRQTATTSLSGRKTVLELVK